MPISVRSVLVSTAAPAPSPRRIGRNLSILFGDGAGAAVLTRTDRTDIGILDQISKTDGQYFKHLWTQAPGSANDAFMSAALVEQNLHQFRMMGKPMFEHAVASLSAVAREILA